MKYAIYQGVDPEQFNLDPDPDPVNHANSDPDPDPGNHANSDPGESCN